MWLKESDQSEPSMRCATSTARLSLFVLFFAIELCVIYTSSQRLTLCQMHARRRSFQFECSSLGKKSRQVFAHTFVHHLLNEMRSSMRARWLDGLHYTSSFVFYKSLLHFNYFSLFLVACELAPTRPSACQYQISLKALFFFAFVRFSLRNPGTGARVFAGEFMFMWIVWKSKREEDKKLCGKFPMETWQLEAAKTHIFRTFRFTISTLYFDYYPIQIQSFARSPVKVDEEEEKHFFNSFRSP